MDPALDNQPVHRIQIIKSNEWFKQTVELCEVKTENFNLGDICAFTSLVLVFPELQYLKHKKHLKTEPVTWFEII